NSRAIDAGETTAIDVQLSPKPFETDTRITVALNFARTQPDVRPLHDKWSSDRRAAILALMPNGVTVGKKLISVEAPKSLNGSVTTGVVSKSKNYNRKLREIDRKMLAIETEAGAVFAEARKRRVEALTIRGISDFADESKGELEAASRGAVRNVAADN